MLFRSETISDEETYEQIKKQLNRMVEVIKVIDFTEISVVMQELMFVKVKNCTPEDKTELFQIAQTYQAKVRDYGKDSVLLEFVHTAHKNSAIIQFLRSEFQSIEVVRGGTVGIEAITMPKR